jgi:hypothetical protein
LHPWRRSLDLTWDERRPAAGVHRPRTEAGDRIVDRKTLEERIAQQRPGWRVVEVTEVNDESGPSFTVVLEKDGQRRTVLVGEAGDVEDQG